MRDSIVSVYCRAKINARVVIAASLYVSGRGVVFSDAQCSGFSPGLAPVLRFEFPVKPPVCRSYAAYTELINPNLTCRVTSTKERVGVL